MELAPEICQGIEANQSKHCVGADELESENSGNCGIVERVYNVPLRIGLLFVMLATSAIGVFVPISISSASRSRSSGFILMTLKQFGTGVIIATALVHVSRIRWLVERFADITKLSIHAQLMFSNSCLGELGYEATTAAIVMVGIMLSFLPDYIGFRILLWKASKAAVTSPTEVGRADSKVIGAQPHPSDASADSEPPEGSPAHEKLKVIILEAGLIFHSLHEYHPSQH